MAALLELFLCLLQTLIAYIAAGGMKLANLLIVGLAAALVAIIPYLPSLPTWPTSDSGWWAWLNWLLPVSSMVSLGGTILSIFLTFYAYRIALRWVKAL